MSQPSVTVVTIYHLKTLSLKFESTTFLNSELIENYSFFVEIRSGTTLTSSH